MITPLRTPRRDATDTGGQSPADKPSAENTTSTGRSSSVSREERAKLGALALELAAHQVAPALSPVIVAGIARLIEFLVIAAVGIAVHMAYVHPVEGFSWGYPAVILATSALSVLAFQAIDSYAPHAMRDVVRQGGKMIAAWIVVFALIIAAAFFLKIGDSFSRLWLAGWFTLGLVALLGFRVALAILVRKWTRNGRLERRAVIVGGGSRAQGLIEALDQSADTDIRICGVFDDRGDDRSPPVVAGYPKLGTVSQLVEFARRTRVDLLIVSLPITAESRVLELLKTLWVLPVDIRLSAHTNKLRFRPRSYSYIGNVPFIDVFDRPITDWDYVLKWLFDRGLGTLMLLAFLPVMAAVALAIKLDSRGPVLFRQKRYGFNNELIEVFKFRSMYVDQCDASASKLVSKGDPRVTRVGRFIRKTSLDELPQLFNVVRGELSIVGPRPHALQAKAADKLYDAVVDGYFARHRVKPGITGWAQINGWRGETDTQEKIQRRVEHDLYYIENWSVLFDLYIMAMTPISLINDRNAY
jgi:Undecaprenyl-phosphate glucose phosphotransferase